MGMKGSLPLRHLIRPRSRLCLPCIVRDLLKRGLLKERPPASRHAIWQSKACPMPPRCVFLLTAKRTGNMVPSG